jgi:hypothetical protein
MSNTSVLSVGGEEEYSSNWKRVSILGVGPMDTLNTDIYIYIYIWGWPSEHAGYSQAYSRLVQSIHYIDMSIFGAGPANTLDIIYYMFWPFGHLQVCSTAHLCTEAVLMD